MTADDPVCTLDNAISTLPADCALVQKKYCSNQVISAKVGVFSETILNGSPVVKEIKFNNTGIWTLRVGTALFFFINRTALQTIHFCKVLTETSLMVKSLSQYDNRGHFSYTFVCFIWAPILMHLDLSTILKQVSNACNPDGKTIEENPNKKYM
jgi:hypothetical protein